MWHVDLCEKIHDMNMDPRMAWEYVRIRILTEGEAAHHRKSKSIAMKMEDGNMHQTTRRTCKSCIIRGESCGPSVDKSLPWRLSVVSFGQNLLKKTVFRKRHHRRSNLAPLPKSAHLINPYCTISRSLSPGLCRDVRNVA